MLTDGERKKLWAYEDEKARTEAQQEPKREVKPKSVGVPYALTVVAGAVVLLIVVYAFMSKGNTGQQSCPDKMGAWIMSQKFVSDRLKAPATASYPEYDESYVTNLGGGKFKVDAYVDAENSFGAKIRSRFTCTVSSSDGTNWHLEDINIE